MAKLVDYPFDPALPNSASHQLNPGYRFGGFTPYGVLKENKLQKKYKNLIYNDHSDELPFEASIRTYGRRCGRIQRI